MENLPGAENDMGLKAWDLNNDSDHAEQISVGQRKRHK